MGHRFNSLFTAILGVCLAGALGGCGSKLPTNYTPLSAIKNVAPPQAARAAYRLMPGDEVEVKFFFAPELNDRMTIRPDGKISIMFAQDIQAADLTAAELASDIRAVLAPHVKQLDLVVIVRNIAVQKAYVGGEISKPGLVPLSGDETVLQILATAGWTTPAGGEMVALVRRDAGGHEKIYPINIAQLESGHYMDQNVRVLPGDVLLVPPSDIVMTDRWVDQNIRQLLPFSTNAGLSYNINGFTSNNQ